MTKERALVEKLLAAADIKINGSRPFDVQVHDDRFYKKAVSQHELGVGEAYMDGWWSSEQLDETISRMLVADLRHALPVTPTLVKAAISGKFANRQKVKKSYKNASAHYDIGNDLYKVMLDKRMIYSCAFWREAKNLDEAQVAKLDRVCKKLHLERGMTLLDIGCGWGGFAQYAAEQYGVRVTGISPAAEQVTLARERTKGKEVTIIQQDYREVEGKYDRIVSIGMLEHVGPKNYRTFFKKCAELLNDDGLMLHHTIGNPKSAKAVDPWVDTYIFPGGVLPSIAQLGGATERLFNWEDLENFGAYYDKTLLAWHENFVKGYPSLKSSKYDEKFYRMWEYYLLSCAGGFRSAQISLWQIVMRKIRPHEVYKAYR